MSLNRFLMLVRPRPCLRLAASGSKSNSRIVNNRKTQPVGEDQNQKERLDEDAQVEFNGKAKVFCRSYTLAKAKEYVRPFVSNLDWS
jgi:hypothetical protein